MNLNTVNFNFFLFFSCTETWLTDKENLKKSINQIILILE
ncbi:Uncharacterized protein dnl_20520 [Desulfonema limicola]|uniref:Uncharacterized protein n=1 Tax=Desulfonema limicola TaxID=45656 RepID=A0A975B6M2_9BACT|nr:Uncharacterized protein dnl_20520 [Desulfonema limicola]